MCILKVPANSLSLWQKLQLKMCALNLSLKLYMQVHWSQLKRFVILDIKSKVKCLEQINPFKEIKPFDDFSGGETTK